MSPQLRWDLALTVSFLFAVAPLVLMYILGDRPPPPSDDEGELFDDEGEPFDVLLEDHPELDELVELGKRIEEVA